MTSQFDCVGATIADGMVSDGDDYEVANVAVQSHRRIVIAFVGMAFEARIAAGPGVLVVCRTAGSQLAKVAESAVRQGYRGMLSFGVAGGLASHLRATNFGRVDLLISGLALPSLPLQTRTAILEAYRGFATLGAWFSQLTVMPLVFWRFYNRLSREVRFDWALWNMPPAGVYHCRGVRSLPRSGQSWRERS